MKKLESNRRRWGVLAAVVPIGVWGCADGSVAASGSQTEATVSGTVTILGKLATEGEVVFDAANVNRRDVAPRRAPIDKDGHYSIKTLIGGNMAIVEGPAIAKNGLAVSNRQPVQVDPGENSVDLKVPATPDSTAPATRRGGKR